MTLREAIEKVASTTRTDREAGARELLDQLQRLAQAHRHRYPETTDSSEIAAGEVAANLCLFCRGGVPESVPRSEDALNKYLARALRNRVLTLHREQRARAYVPIDFVGTDGEPAGPTKQVLRAEESRQRALLEDDERAQYGEEISEHALGLMKRLALAAIAAVRERHRDDHARTWNELVEYQNGQALDDLIRAAGEAPNEQARNRRYASFARFRVKLLAAAQDERLTFSDLEIVRAFVTRFLTFRREVSDRFNLRVLRVEGKRDEL